MIQNPPGLNFIKCHIAFDMNLGNGESHAAQVIRGKGSLFLAHERFGSNLKKDGQ
jgi:hypothetical protein